MLFFKTYIVALILFLLMDYLWLGVFAKNLYKEQIGHLMTDKIQWYAAVLFYVLFILALKYFAIDPALNEGDWTKALINGAFFGFISYAAYDLTNLSTLKDWPLKISILDMLWGTIISGTTATLTFLITKKLFI